MDRLDKRTKRQRDRGTKGQNINGTRGQMDKDTKGQKDKRTRGQWDSETAHMLLEGLKFVLILPPLMSKKIKSTCFIFD